jgi:hypothetical protein
LKTAARVQLDEGKASTKIRKQKASTPLPTTTATTMHSPGLGEVHLDSQFGWYRSCDFVAVPMLGRECFVLVDGYAEDDNPGDFHVAIANLLDGERDILQKASHHIFRYYQDMNSYWSPDDPEYVSIAAPKDVWRHIQLGSEPMVSRRAYGDKGVYVSIECNCDWEPEHGLQIVLKNGSEVTKVGPYDGHLTNSDAYADSTLEGVVYKDA